MGWRGDFGGGWERGKWGGKGISTKCLFCCSQSSVLSKVKRPVARGVMVSPFPISAPYSSFPSLSSSLKLPVQTTSFSHILHPFRGNVRVYDAKGLKISLLRGRRNGGIKGNHVEKEGVREGWKVEM